MPVLSELKIRNGTLNNIINERNEI